MIKTVSTTGNRKMSYEVEIILYCDEKPTVQDVLDYINELGEDLHFEVKGGGDD